MSFRSLTPTGDWSFGDGKASYATAQKAIGLNIQTRLAFWLNDFFSAMQTGIDWANLLGGKSPEADQAIILQTRVTVAMSYGVVKVLLVDATKDSVTRRFVVRYAIDTIYSKGVIATFSPSL